MQKQADTKKNKMIQSKGRSKADTLLLQRQMKEASIARLSRRRRRKHSRRRGSIAGEGSLAGEGSKAGEGSIAGEGEA